MDKKAKLGRPSKKEKKFSLKYIAIELWKQNKLPPKDICEVLGISLSTFDRIKKEALHYNEMVENK